MSNLAGKHGVHPAGTRGLPHGGFYGGYGAHYRGKREAEAEGDAEPRDERSYGHGKAAHPGPGRIFFMLLITSWQQQKMLDWRIEQKDGAMTMKSGLYSIIM